MTFCCDLAPTAPHMKDMLQYYDFCIDIFGVQYFQKSIVIDGLQSFLFAKRCSTIFPRNLKHLSKPPHTEQKRHNYRLQRVTKSSNSSPTPVKSLKKGEPKLTQTPQPSSQPHDPPHTSPKRPSTPRPPPSELHSRGYTLSLKASRVVAECAEM